MKKGRQAETDGIALEILKHREEYTMEHTTLGIIGYGKMSAAILAGAQKRQLLENAHLFLYTPSAASRERASQELPGVQICESAQTVCAHSPSILLGVKPQIMPVVLEELREDLQDHLLISIAAGLTIASIQQSLPPSARVFRCMPNLAAQCGESATLLCLESAANPAEKDFVCRLFGAAGDVFWVREGQMDAASAVAGSGPAFAALFVEALADAGVAEGLPRGLAVRLAAQMAKGSAVWLQSQGEISPALLKDAVCSPGGTSIEGVMALEQAGFRHAVMDAVRKTSQKCKDIANQSSK